MSLILGIETSCDETAAAVVADGRVVRSNIIASQHELHEEYLGVVPEIASRAHLERIMPVVDRGLREADVTLNELDAVAVGNRPGLIGSLLIGVTAAKTLAWSLNQPLIGVDHIHAHLYAAALVTDKDTIDSTDEPLPYPALGLVVSGGHTSLFLVKSPLEMTVIGRTIDDAVGEAYDKAAVLLGLGFPGGPKVDRLAQTGDAGQFDLPRSMLDKQSLDFSFSGLKTALLYTIRGKPDGRDEHGKAKFHKSIDDWDKQSIADLAASFQRAAIEAVIAKMRRAIDQLAEKNQPPRSIIIGGGVSANSMLRRRVAELGEQRGLPVHLPPMAYCLDNAAMIAGLAHHSLAAGHRDDLHLPAAATSSQMP